MVVALRWCTLDQWVSSMMEYATGEYLSNRGRQKVTGLRSNMTSSSAFTAPESSSRPEKNKTSPLISLHPL